MPRTRPPRRTRRLTVATALAAGALAAVAVLVPGPQAAAGPSHAAASSEPIYLDTSYTPAERAADLVGRMTTAEKAGQMVSSRAPAIKRLGVAAWGWWNESNHGVNASTLTPSGNATTLTNTTSYPSDLAMGSTWNPGLVYDEASRIGAEAREVSPGNTENLDFYAPTVNLSRDPRWGRNDETWGEDPTLTGNLASQYVDGLQGENRHGKLPASAHGYYQALATLKHYAANNDEDHRLDGNSVMDQRTLREYYTAQFASIIRQANPGSIMSSYNEVNGTPSPANVQLMQTLARETFGFKGYFTSDCDAVYIMQGGHHWTPPNSTQPVDQYTRAAYAISAGEDLECNAGYRDNYDYSNTVPTALKQHIRTQTDTFNIGDVDTSLVRLFTARIETGEFDSESAVPWVARARRQLGGTTWTDSDANHAITETPARLRQARQSADQSLVLLKNHPTASGRSLLPLKVPSHGKYRIAVEGYYAHPQSLFLGGYSSIQASAGTANEVDSYEGIKKAVKAIDPQATVDYLPGVTGGTTGATLTHVDANSIKAAKNYNAVVVVAGTDYTTGEEAQDRTSLQLPGAQNSMIKQTEAANPNTVVYLETMGLMNVNSFQKSTPSLLWSSYNGMRQGQALADVLLGKVNPNGHLPFTWYSDPHQIPRIGDYAIRSSSGSHGRTYQYFNGATFRPFGYGQSYTHFRYSDLRLDRTHANANGTVRATVRVTNTGRTAGRTVAQLYATTPDATPAQQRPAKRLEAFQKVYLRPGRSRQLSFTVDVPKLAFYDTDLGHYVVDPGRYGMQIGSSATDVAATRTVTVAGALRPTPTVVTGQPVAPGDAAKGVQQRVFFPKGSVVDPQVTVSTIDQQLYGYLRRGHSRALPSGMRLTYRSDDPGVVQVGKGGVLRTVHDGVATVTVTARDAGGRARGTFVVDVR